MAGRAISPLKFKYVNFGVNINKEVFVKHEKAPTAPRFEGVMTISYMPMFWKITAFGHFWSNSGSRKCHKAHLHTNTIHLNLFPGLYYRPLERYSLESTCLEKLLILDILAKFGNFRWPNLAKTVKRHIYRPRPFI